jgi:phenylacetate-CoA ligase
MRLWFRRETVRLWYALFEARWRRWYGISRHDRWANIGGQLVAPVHQQKPPFWVWNAGLSQLYMSSYHLSPKFLPDYVHAIQAYGVKYLYGYTSSLCALADQILRAGGSPLRLQVALTNAEPLLDHQRSQLARAFACPVRETYGMSEASIGASQCEAGRLHLWPELGVLEVLQGDQPIADGMVGDLVSTSLLNADMPLIRYRVGDRGRLPAQKLACDCGRTLPCLESVEGRIDDQLLTRDGRRIGRLDPVFKADLPLREAQVIQETLERVRVKYVPEPRFSREHEQAIVQRLRDRLGQVSVEFEALDAIPRGPNGKLRTVLCQLSAAERLMAESPPSENLYQGNTRAGG